MGAGHVVLFAHVGCAGAVRCLCDVVECRREAAKVPCSGGVETNIGGDRQCGSPCSAGVPTHCWLPAMVVAVATCYCDFCKKQKSFVGIGKGAPSGAMEIHLARIELATFSV